MARQPKRGRPKSTKTGGRVVRKRRALAYDIDIFRLLLDRLDFGAAIVSVHGMVEYSNSRFGEMVAASPLRPVTNSNLRSHVSAASWPALEVALRKSAHIRSEGQLDIDVVSGNRRSIHVAFFPLIQGESRQLVGIIATEETKLREATLALKDSEASLQTVSARLLRVQDEERRHMARDLHDTIGQELAVAVMRVEQIAKDVDSPEADLRKQLAECSEWLRKIENETRTLSYVLHPPLLDQIGLVPALNWYIEGFSKRSGLKVQVEVNSKIPRLDVEQETALFRIVQESLTNVLRHSGSVEAKVRVAIENNYLSVSVEDKGKGFKSQASREKPKGVGVGIAGMRGRLSLVQGSLEIQSTEHGTTVSARVPLREREQKYEVARVATESSEGTRSQAGRVPAPIGTYGAVAPGAVARILIADDHEIARRGIRDLFRGENDIEICGEASDGLEALSKAEELRPDLLIVDLSMPKLGGFSVANQIRRSDPAVKILVYSTHSHPDVERMARSAGCSGCVHKANAARDLVRGARTVLRGGVFYERDAGEISKMTDKAAPESS